MLRLFIVFPMICTCLAASAATFYADASRIDDSGAATNWATAKRTIQAAVDIASSADTVLVAPGTYSEGGQVEPGYMLMNRLYLGKGVTVQSTGGSSITTIQGGANIRGVCMDHNDAVLDGFTISGGQALNYYAGDFNHDLCGGGVYGGDAPGSMVKNCTITSCSSPMGFSGGAHKANLTDCTLQANSSGSDAGGAGWSTLLRCSLVGNSSAGSRGGGAGYCTLNDCLISSNIAKEGAGILGGFATNCTLAGNQATYYGGSGGGGAIDATLVKCRIMNNNGGDGNGGGVAGNSTCHNCLITGNSSQQGGGGASQSYLYGCTISDNTAVYEGGAAGGFAYNSIIYGNHGSWDESSSFLYNSCTPVLSVHTDMGGNITDNPRFANAAAGDYGLQSGSPCKDTGNKNYTATEVDFPGRPRIVFGQVDMGAYEYVFSSNDYDGDGVGNYDETVADTDMTDSNDWFHITALSNGPPVTIHFSSSSNRLYTLLWSSNLASNDWKNVPGVPPRTGSGGADYISSTNDLPSAFYKLAVELP